jgi:HK97 family phage major capsid protein
MGLIGSLDYAYQQGASFMMHQAVWNTLLQLADSQARPLFLDLLNGNAPRLLGYPVTINNAMASSIAAAAKTILFGDFSKFMIREIGDIELLRLTERYADKYQTGFMAVVRRDAKVMQSAAIKRITQPAS